MLIEGLSLGLNPLGPLLHGVVGLVDQPGVHIGLPAVFAVAGHVVGVEGFQGGGVFLAEGHPVVLGPLGGHGIGHGGVHAKVQQGLPHGGAVLHLVRHLEGHAVVAVIIIGHIVLLVGGPIQRLGGGDGGISHRGHHVVGGIGPVCEVAHHVIQRLLGDGGVSLGLGGGAGGSTGGGGGGTAAGQAQGQGQQQRQDADLFHVEYLLLYRMRPWAGGRLSAWGRGNGGTAARRLTQWTIL